MLPAWLLHCAVFGCLLGYYNVLGQLKYRKNPAPDGHRCGICPTYYRKICAFDFTTNLTYIFDNHCVMDLYNCIHATDFEQTNYGACLYFGNFAYVHGLKYEDQDYDEDHIMVIGAKKNPDFA
ncbi:uncharacterized protein LOC134754132 [Cydia strobilella]|uniref:uncharacterized protein LOC134754132 n=1 Tax=Cydia strobilella TaxID=1100964 RepID=UPI003006E33C